MNTKRAVFKNIDLERIKSKYYYLDIDLIQVAIKPLTRIGLNFSIHVCMRFSTFKI